jgi:polysaccharide chain length determinant protein (PEP-CTERM system associated)
VLSSPEYGSRVIAPSRQLGLADYWRIVCRRKTLLIGLCSFTFIGVALWTLSLPNIYRASTLILVEAQKVPDTYVRSTVSTSVQERLRTLAQQIKSRTRLEQVIVELQLLQDIQDRRSVESFIKKMLENIEVEARNNDAFTVSYAGEEPQVVMQVANKLASLFIEENLKVREQHAIGTTQFFADEMQRVRSVLETQEKTITEFKHQYLGELPGQQEANQRALDRLQLQIQAAQDAIESAGTRKGLLMQQLSMLPTEVSTQTTAEVLANPLGQQLIQRQETLAEMQGTFTDDYPDVSRLKQEIARLQAQVTTDTRSHTPTVIQTRPVDTISAGLRWRIQEELQQIELQMQTLQREQANSRKRIAEYEQKIANSAQREQELMVLTRDYESTRQDYASLLERQMRAKLAENLEKRQKAEQFKVLDPARLPTHPWKPDRLKLLMMGLVIGLGVGGGAVFLAEFLDRSFRNPVELKQYTTLPVLATIPLMITASEQRVQRRKKLLLYGACVLVPAATLSAVHVYWMKLNVLLDRTLQYLRP